MHQIEFKDHLDINNQGHRVALGWARWIPRSKKQSVWIKRWQKACNACNAFFMYNFQMDTSPDCNQQAYWALRWGQLCDKDVDKGMCVIRMLIRVDVRKPVAKEARARRSFSLQDEPQSSRARLIFESSTQSCQSLSLCSFLQNFHVSK